jgi:hypothetical protein
MNHLCMFLIKHFNRRPAVPFLNATQLQVIQVNSLFYIHNSNLLNKMLRRANQSLLKAILIGYFCLNYSDLKSQTSTGDSSIYTAAISSATDAYDSVWKGLNTGIYNGIEHLGYVNTIKGTAYFGPVGWQKGSVFYDGVQYQNVQVKYDIVKDLLLIAHPNGYTVFSLFSPRVDSFSFAGHRFFYLKDKPKNLPSGFYELLQEGKLSILAKRKKKINENALAPERGERFDTMDEFYAEKDGNYYRIKTEKQIVALYPDRSKEAHRYLRSGKIKFRKDPEKAILRLAQYYNG